MKIAGSIVHGLCRAACNNAGSRAQGFINATNFTNRMYNPTNRLLGRVGTQRNYRLDANELLKAQRGEGCRVPDCEKLAYCRIGSKMEVGVTRTAVSNMGVALAIGGILGSVAYTAGSIFSYLFGAHSSNTNESKDHEVKTDETENPMDVNAYA